MSLSQKPRMMAIIGLCTILSRCPDAGGNDQPGPGDRESGTAFRQGVNHAHIHKWGHGYGSRISAAELDSLRSIGANWIAIMPYGYQRGVSANRIVGFPGHEGASEFFSRIDETMTDDDIIVEIRNAHNRGLSVMVKPQIWSDDFWNNKEWHGTIRQTSESNHVIWWESYRRFALHYADVAQRAGAELYCMGTELVMMSTQYPSEWRALIRELRAIYSGNITYAAHWDREYKAISFWDDLDFIGVNAYFPLDAPPDAGVEQLASAWKTHHDSIKTFATRVGRPVILTEVGFRGVRGGHQKPWEFKGKATDLLAAARAYEAMFRVFHGSGWFAGMFLWKTYTDPSQAYEPRDGSGFSFRTTPAESVIRKWYGGRVGQR